MEPMNKKEKEKLEIIYKNSYHIWMCNNELKYVFENANKDEFSVYSNNPFLQFCIDNINVRFCILATILISENEEFSISKFIKENIDDCETRRNAWNIIYNYDFQIAWQKIKVLRDKCYAHNDRQIKKVKNEIKLAQHERNIFCKGIADCVKKIYSGLLDTDAIAFDSIGSPMIAMQMRILSEWNICTSNKAYNRIRL